MCTINEKSSLLPASIGAWMKSVFWDTCRELDRGDRGGFVGGPVHAGPIRWAPKQIDEVAPEHRFAPEWSEASWRTDFARAR